MNKCRHQAGQYRRRGVAMVIVLVLVAMATAMSVALLAGQGAVEQTADTASRATAGDALAQSGIAIAEYYLQNPTAAPVLNGNGYYPGQTGISLGSAANGTVDVTVTQTATNTYAINSTAHYGTAGNMTSRSVAAVATTSYSFTPTDAAAINGGLNVYTNMTINGNIHANGGVNVALGATVNGTIYAPSLTGLLSSVLGGFVTIDTSNGVNQVPTSINSYLTYNYNGATYSAAKLTYTAGTLGPTATNPMGVYYDTGDVTITNAITINGTLLVPSGKLIVKTSNLTVTAQAGMPALIVNSDVGFSGANKKLTVNGLSYIGGQLTKSGTSSSDVANFTGSVQFAGSNAVDKNLSATVTITYDKAKASVNNFVTGGNTKATTIKLTSFKNSASS